MPPPERRPDIIEAVERFTLDLESQVARMAREIMEQEDQEILSVLERAGTFSNGSATPPLQMRDFAALREVLDRQVLRPGRIIMNEQDHRDLLAWGREEQRIPAGRRVQIPEFELFSNPTIHLGDVQRRRFDIFDRNMPDPAVQRILEAVVRAKAAPLPQPFTRTGVNPRSVWEALVDLDLVDASSS